MPGTDEKTLSAASIIITYARGVIFIAGTVGNVMNIIAFCSLKIYRSLVTSTFLAGAAFAGQIYLTIMLGFASVSKWISYDIPSRNPVICKFDLYIRTVSIQIYLTCLCLSSIDRELMTLKRARLLICVLAIVWMCVGIHRALYSNNLPFSDLCTPSSNFVVTATYLNLIVAVILPIIILSIFGILTWKNLRNTRLLSLNSQVFRHCEGVDQSCL